MRKYRNEKGAFCNDYGCIRPVALQIKESNCRIQI